MRRQKRNRMVESDLAAAFYNLAKWAHTNSNSSEATKNIIHRTLLKGMCKYKKKRKKGRRRRIFYIVTVTGLLL